MVKLKNLDETLLNESEMGRSCLRLKIWQDAKVQLHGSDKLLTIDELHRGDKIAVMVEIYKWSFEGRKGTSLTISHVLVIEQAEHVSDTPDWM